MAAAGYSGTPLAKKLGIAEGARLFLVNAPDDYLDLVAPLPAGVRFDHAPDAGTSLIHAFCKERAQLAALLAAWRPLIGPAAIVWVSWPKKAARVATDITEDTIRELALPLGFVDVKVCAVDDTWSGLKLVIRKALR